MTTDREPPPFNGHEFPAAHTEEQAVTDVPIYPQQPAMQTHPITALQIGMNVTEDSETQHIIVMNTVIDRLRSSCGQAAVLRVLNYLTNKHTQGGVA